MERILILIDSSGIKDATFDFAYFLAGQTRSKLVALFTHDAANVMQQPILATHPEHSGSDRQRHLIEESLMAANASALGFGKYCRNRGITWEAETAYVRNVEDVVMQTRFADLLIIDAGVTFFAEEDNVPSTSSLQILANSECPVFVAPASFEGLEEIVFAYDGSPSSTYAIKQFIHLFPQLSYSNAVLLEVIDKQAVDLVDRLMIMNYLKHHFYSAHYTTLPGDAPEEMFTYFFDKKNVFFVMGAFSRGTLATHWRSSTAELLLKTSANAVFISHK